MAEFRLPKLNSWVTTLVLASVGLHGLVLALPMPNVREEPNEPSPLPDPEVIQVVTLPKLARAPESPQSPIPEPPLEEPVTLEPPPLDEPVVLDPAILEEPALEDVIPGNELESEAGFDDEFPQEDDIPEDLTLDQQIARLDFYTDYDGGRVGDSMALARLAEIAQLGEFPMPLRGLEQSLEPILVPLQDCLEEPPGESVSVVVQVGADGTLVNEPELLNSTGYGVLDKKALAIAQAADYAAHHSAGDETSYSFKIPVNYDACNVATGLTNAQTSG